LLDSTPIKQRMEYGRSFVESVMKVPCSEESVKVVTLGLPLSKSMLVEQKNMIRDMNEE
jgi:hypothetical protein